MLEESSLGFGLQMSCNSFAHMLVLTTLLNSNLVFFNADLILFNIDLIVLNSNLIHFDFDLILFNVEPTSLTTVWQNITANVSSHCLSLLVFMSLTVYCLG